MPSTFKLDDYFYAHRGLWTPDGLVENSMAAFEAAAENGFGIEFDVRLSKDGVPICFHDESLSRMTGDRGLISNKTASELTELTLVDGVSTIPLLEDLLSVWPTDLPMLLEMKADAQSAQATAEAVQTLINPSERLIGIMSFEADAVAGISPQFLRGLLIEPKMIIGDELFDQKHALGREKLSVDYFSVWHQDAEASQSRSEGYGLAAWTLKSPEEAQSCSKFTRAQIFEGFDPRAVATD